MLVRVRSTKEHLIVHRPECVYGRGGLVEMGQVEGVVDGVRRIPCNRCRPDGGVQRHGNEGEGVARSR